MMELSTTTLILFLSLVRCIHSLQLPFSFPFVKFTNLINPAPLQTTQSNSLFTLHKQLIDIQSTTGQEKYVADYLYDHLRYNNYTVEKHHVTKERYNIYAYKGYRRTKVLLTSHIDTVPPHIPYKLSSDWKGSYIAGRGSNDAKGSVAAQITALNALYADDILQENDRVGLLYVVGEEYDGVGMKYTNSHQSYGWESVIFGEPTENKLAIGHKGLYAFHINVKGSAAHSGYPELGVSATEKLLDILQALRSETWPVDDLLGPTTMNIALLKAGEAINIIPGSASASIAFRVSANLESIEKKVASVIHGHGAKIDVVVKYPPQELASEGEALESFEKVVVSYGTDIPYLSGQHKKYLYGPGSILTAHGSKEMVYKKDLEDSVEGYKKLILHALGRET